MPAKIEEGPPERTVDLPGAGVQLPGPLQAGEGFVPEAELHRDLRGAAEKLRVVGGAPQAARVGLHRGGEILRDRLQVVAHPHVRGRKVRRQLQRPLGGRACPLGQPGGRAPVEVQGRAGIGEPGPGQGEAGVERDRLLVLHHHAVESDGIGALALDVEPLQVGLVGGQVRRRALRELSPLLLRQHQLEGVRHLTGDVLLHREDVLDLGVEGLLPAGGGGPVARHLHELRRDTDAAVVSVLLPPDLGQEEKADPELLGDLLRGQVRALVLARAGAGDHRETGQPGELGPHLVRHPLREVRRRRRSRGSGREEPPGASPRGARTAAVSGAASSARGARATPRRPRVRRPGCAPPR